MKVSIREGMIPRETLQDKLDWLPVRRSRGGRAAHRHALAASGGDSGGVRRLAHHRLGHRGHPPPAQRRPCRAGRGQTSDPGAARAGGALGAVGVLRAAVRRVAALPTFRLWPPARSSKRDLLLAQLRELAPDAQAAGVSLFLEPLNRYEAWASSTGWSRAPIATEVGPEVGVMADFFT